jgi:hypothetical protein
MPSRRVLVAIALAVAVAASPAHAETEVLEVDPPGPPGPPAVHPARLGFYGEVSLGYGYLSGETVSPTNRDRAMTDSGGGHLRWALGARVTHLHLDARFGGVIDVVNTDGAGAAFGAELQVDWPLPAGWRAGVRGSLSAGNGNGSPTTLDGLVGCAGVRLRKDAAIIGLDAVRVDQDRAQATGAIVTVGLGGRPGKVLVGVSAAATAVLGVLAIGLMAGATTH